MMNIIFCGQKSVGDVVVRRNKTGNTVDDLCERGLAPLAGVRC